MHLISNSDTVRGSSPYSSQQQQQQQEQQQQQQIAQEVRGRHIEKNSR
jgi:hypothetical protein